MALMLNDTTSFHVYSAKSMKPHYAMIGSSFVDGPGHRLREGETVLSAKVVVGGSRAAG